MGEKTQRMTRTARTGAVQVSLLVLAVLVILVILVARGLDRHLLVSFSRAGEAMMGIGGR